MKVAMVYTTRLDERLRQLLKDFGYRLEGNKTLIQSGVQGFTADRICGHARDAFDACEQLIPIIRDDNFHSEFRRITKG